MTRKRTKRRAATSIARRARNLAEASQLGQAAAPATVYIVYDARAASGNTDDAAVLSTADSLEEARADVKMFADMFPGACIYQYDLSDNVARDERGPL